MKSFFKKIKSRFAIIISITTFAFSSMSGIAYADNDYGITMSPMNQKIVLNAGESYTGSFTISNAINNAKELKYKIVIQPFFVDDNYNVYYEKEGDINQIVDWTTVDIESGTLPVGETQIINFTIDVPENAPAGGQYEAITAVSVNDGDVGGSDEVGVGFNQSIAITHIVYTEIAGTTVRQGEVQSADVPSFLLSGNITASSTIKNTGNTHGTAKYKLQIFPLFSNEEVYTNEENPDEKTILPDRSLYNETVWDKTPDIGIFNVKYTVEFEGVTTEVSKMVIKCPAWLLFIIFFVIAAIIIWIVMRVRGRSKANKRTVAVSKQG